MRLDEFILSDLDEILLAWESAARDAPLATTRGGGATLRARAAALLRAVAAELAQARTPANIQAGLSTPGHATAASPAIAPCTRGLDVHQTCLEHRLLRASVLRLWGARRADAPPDFDDLCRFDDAIDRALADAVRHVDTRAEESRNLLLGALGHDLRNPLDAIQITSSYLAKLDAGDGVARAAQRLRNSAGRMKTLLDDLLDYNRATLGAGITLHRRPIDLAEAIETELQQLLAAHPECTIEFEAEGDTRGRFDEHRLQQLVGNLVTNAIKYGDDAPVRVRVVGDAGGGTSIEVRNRGPAIAPEELAQLFEPLRRGSTAQGRPESTSLGLGLYIAREIVRAHGGAIEARRADGETVFAIALPPAMAGEDDADDDAFAPASPSSLSPR